jgi:hypothetical protein
LFSDKDGTLAGFIKIAEEKERSCLIYHTG